ncbi:MAG: endonuclease/exonuclease/phosphatase family protein [Actinobacteria bacterium]|nr:endonuclease/exonuclease/phosphatase family protein [Actinomycetota bacterium]
MDRTTRRGRVDVEGFGADVLLPALVVMLGMQMLRVLLPLLVYVLRDRAGLQATHLGVVALALFAGAFLVGPLQRALGTRRLMVFTAGGLALVRLALQLWTGDPFVDLGLAMAGALLFVLFLPALRSATSLLLGLALDTGLNGVLLTYDLAWRGGTRAIVTVAVLAAVVGYLLYTGRGREEGGGVGSCGRAGPWLAVGPALALQMLVFQNVARTAALSDLFLPTAALLTLAAHVLGLVLVSQSAPLLGSVAASRCETHEAARPAIRRAQAAALVSVAGVALVLSMAVAAPAGMGAVLQVVAGQAALAIMVAVVVGSVSGGPSSAPGKTGAAAWRGGAGRQGAGRAAAGSRVAGRGARLSLAHGAGMVVFVALLFLAYSGYDIALPFSADVIPLVAAVALGACALWAVLGSGRIALDAADVRRAAVSRPPVSPLVVSAPLALVLALGVVSLGQALLLERPAAQDGLGKAGLRVMNYNLHNGFATDGRLDLEALAATIEAEDPDVLALQEVSRGWVINGSVDMLGWLSGRLGMVPVYGPTAGPLWGNAVLTRLPIESEELFPLPTEDLLLRRGLIDVSLALGDAGSLRVIATHYHHPDDGGPVRVLESEEMLRVWGGASRTVVMGDLNGRPGDREIEMLREAGLVEVLAEAGVSPGYTFPSDGPIERIDYIWVTSDLLPPGQGPLADVRVTAGTASDHLGIAATLGLRR